MDFQKALAVWLTIATTVTFCDNASGGVNSICNFSNSVFLNEPTNVLVKKGQHATFACSVYVYAMDYDYIEWQIDPDMYDTSVSENYFTYNKRHVLMSTLKVYDVGKTSQFIRCLFHTRQNKSIGEMCYVSRSARNTVQYFPSRSDVKCKPQKLEPLEEGDVLTISCRVLRCVPPVDMSWRLNGNTSVLLPKPIQYDDGLTRVLTLRLLVTSDFHMKTMTCLVTNHNTFPDQKLPCTIGPVLVMTPPDVIVHPRQGVFFSSKEISFIFLYCRATGYPDIQNFTWSCIPPGIVEGCNTTVSRWNASLISRQSTDNDISSINISCFASNRVGMGSSTSQFKILPLPNQNTRSTDEVRVIEGKESDSINIQLMQFNTTHIFYTIFIKKLENTLNITTIYCFSENTSMTESGKMLTSNMTYKFDLVVPLSAVGSGNTIRCEAIPHKTISVVFELSSSNFTLFYKQQSSTLRMGDEAIKVTLLPALTLPSNETEEFSKELTSLSEVMDTKSTFKKFDSPYVTIDAPESINSMRTYSTWKIIVIALSGIIILMVLLVSMVICVSTLVLRSSQRKNITLRQVELQDTMKFNERRRADYKQDTNQDDISSTSDPSYEVPITSSKEIVGFHLKHEYDSKLTDSTSTGSCQSWESIYSSAVNSSHDGNETTENERQIPSRYSV